MAKKALTTNTLMRRLRNKGVRISGSHSKNDLLNYGYFHAYKGYRFVRNNVSLPISNFEEIVALVDFDNDVKSLLFPYLSFIETAVKNRAVTEIQLFCGSVDVNSAFLSAFNRFQAIPAGPMRAEEMRERLTLETKIYESIKRELKINPIIDHFVNNSEPIPLYAVAEIIDFGTLGLMLRCSNNTIRNSLSEDVGIPFSRDVNREMLYQIIFTLKDLRNAIAHNSPVFDCRFHKFPLSQPYLSLVETDTGVSHLTMNKITDYLVLIVFLLKHLGCSKTEMKKLVRSFEETYDALCHRVSPSLASLVFVYSVPSQLSLLKGYISR
jgi:abortive infection bacteriophage resistance protein